MCARKSIDGCAVAIAIMAISMAFGQDRPAALAELEKSRMAFPSGRIEWSILREGDPEKAMNYVSRYAANGDQIFENRGDKDGWTLFNGQTGAGYRRYPQIFMSNQEGFWAHEESTTNCTWWSEKNGENRAKKSIQDIRALGLHPSSETMQYQYAQMVLAGDLKTNIIEWTQEEADELLVVTAHLERDATFTWYINPQRGWNAERVEYVSPHYYWEAVSSLANFDGVWFPEETRYYRDGQLTETIIVRSATLNQSEDPKKFTLNDLGLEPGSSIAAQDLPPKSGKELRTWNGEGVVPFESWAEDVRAGRRVEGPIHKRMFQKGYFESIYDTPEQIARTRLAMLNMQIKFTLSRHVGLWEQYVRDFIARYKLDDEQSQKAWTIFLECRRRGDDLIARNKARLTELVSLSLAAGEEGDKEKEAKYDKELAKLRAPVDRIFEESLKPRLEKLPTRAQRKAAETPDETQAGTVAEQAAPASSPAP